MITAIFATGTSGEFGLKGKLPWGSFPEELETYKDTIISIVNQPFMAHTAILMGRLTWDTLPEAAIEFLLSQTNNVIIVGRSGVQCTHDAEITYISNLGSTLPPDWEYMNIICIGGASVLNSLLAHGHLNKAYISTVYYDTPNWRPSDLLPRSVGDLVYMRDNGLLDTPFNYEFDADTFAPLHYFDDKTSMFVAEGYRWKDERKDRPLHFRQEVFFL